VRVIERGSGADAFELLGADLDDSHPRGIVKMRNDVIRHGAIRCVGRPLPENGRFPVGVKVYLRCSLVSMGGDFQGEWGLIPGNYSVFLTFVAVIRLSPETIFAVPCSGILLAQLCVTN
jgi:hypothetical protein